jgi:hypothetical protein
MRLILFWCAHHLAIELEDARACENDLGERQICEEPQILMTLVKSKPIRSKPPSCRNKTTTETSEPSARELHNKDTGTMTPRSNLGSSRVSVACSALFGYCMFISCNFQLSESLSMPPIATSTRASKSLHDTTTSLFSIFDDDDDGVKNTEKNDGVDFAKFNPLSYKTSKSSSANAYTGTQISLRKTRIQELTNELMNVAADESATRQILLNYKDFLLEPLEDPEAVLVRDICSVLFTSIDRLRETQFSYIYNLFSLSLYSTATRTQIQFIHLKCQGQTDTNTIVPPWTNACKRVKMVKSELSCNL